MKVQVTIELDLPDAADTDDWLGWNLIHGGAMTVTSHGQLTLGITEAIVVNVEPQL